jgi:hypothetical protein
MELDHLIEKLRRERTKLDEMVASLQQLREAMAELKPLLKGKRGRKFMDEAGRKEVSERMKKYWAAWRTQKTP